VILVLSISLAAARVGEAQDDRRRAELDRLLRILPRVDAWQGWLRRTGELPPDFDALERVPGLPDPLVLREGGHDRPVTSAAQWQRRRAQILELFARYVFGSVPPPPADVRATVLRVRQAEGASIQETRLEFGPDHRARLGVELMIPSGRGPFPAFVTPVHSRSWGLIALRRGYVVCVFNGSDGHDDTAGFVPVWPGYDWGKLARRAFAASRCVDYLSTLPVVDGKRIGIAGHSRNGKMALIAAATDERFAAVVSGSSGTAGAGSYRFYGDAQLGEGIEIMTRSFPDWVHPRLRFFAGREDRLPLDANLLLALVAPRACLITNALNDFVESSADVQGVYLSAQRVYRLLGAADRLRVKWREGSHEFLPADIEGMFDWFDTAFGRRRFAFPETFVHPRYEDWQASGETVHAAAFPVRGLDDLLTTEDGRAIGDATAWHAKAAEVRKRVLWATGDAPPRGPGENLAQRYDVTPLHHAVMLMRAEPAHESDLFEGTRTRAAVVKQSLVFGEHISGDLYTPQAAASPGRKLPVVLWLAPQSVPDGYSSFYQQGERLPLALAAQGFAVFAFDPIGTGLRIHEASSFYARYPRWSLLGKAVRDVSAAMDAVAAVPLVDASRIYALGFGTGAMVGLHAAALDPRLAGVVSVCGFAPMRPGGAARGTGGIAAVSTWYPWQPRLGAFAGQEARIPYDYHEVLALIAPRPVVVISPSLDREHALADVEATVERASRIYRLLGASQALRQESPEDFGRLSEQTQERAFAILKELAFPRSVH
jgi:dienelactone hydrolase